MKTAEALAMIESSIMNLKKRRHARKFKNNMGDKIWGKEEKKPEPKVVKEQSANVLKDYINKADIYRDKKYTKLALKKIADKKKAAKTVKEGRFSI